MEGERRIKGIAMAQWVNRLPNNIFVNPPPLPLSCEISGALHLAQPGLTAGFAKFTLLDVESRHFVLQRHKCSDETGS